MSKTPTSKVPSLSFLPPSNVESSNVKSFKATSSLDTKSSIVDPTRDDSEYPITAREYSHRSKLSVSEKTPKRSPKKVSNEGELGDTRPRLVRSKSTPEGMYRPSHTIVISSRTSRSRARSRSMRRQTPPLSTPLIEFPPWRDEGVTLKRRSSKSSKSTLGESAYSSVSNPVTPRD